MNFRIVLVLVVVGFVVFCGWLVAESGLDCRFRGNDKGAAGQSCILLQKTMADEKGEPRPSEGRDETTGAPGGGNERLEAADFTTFEVYGGSAQIVTLGAADPETEDPDIGFKFQLELSSKGAAIRKATFSNGNDNGFDDRDYKDPQPLVILSPVSRPDGGEILSMANKEFIFVEHKLQLLLNDLHWKSYDVEKAEDGSQTARFEAIIKDDKGQPVVKLIKTYKVTPGRYLLECKLTVENLSGIEQEVRFNLTGPLGIGREGIRSDMRKVVGGVIDSGQQVKSTRLDANKLKRPKIKYLKAYLTYLNPYRKWWAFWETIPERKDKAQKTMENAKQEVKSMRLFSHIGGAHPIWISATNKYFAAILRPVPDADKNCVDWLADNHVEYYDPDINIFKSMSVDEAQKVLEEEPDGDETVGVDLKIASSTLARTGQADSAKTYNFQLYLGPKDKSLFDKNEMYRELGFVQTIDFMGCCCPASIISPLAFGILAIMRWMYGFIANYGVVIIILVFVFRMVMHPITKKSQVSMSKMTKLAPKAAEIKKKYANNKAEMNKQMMALYKEQGASPIMGFLPMMVQMPIWIALWSAIYASIELRGAAFLPFWITDLSVPDALYRFPTVIIVPLLRWKIASLNLLPLLMGVAFYLQQKLMPKQATASAGPQAAQQQQMQKTMMIMMPLLFPLMLYNAPSGVNLYIMASTFAGVFEQHVIRKHIREKEQAESKGLVAATSKTGGKVKKKKPKPFYRY